MLYFENESLRIRTMTESDTLAITEAEIAQGWHVTQEKYLCRLADMAAGKSVALAAEYQGRTVGYINVYFRALGGPFASQGYPEIVDFGVLEAYRNKGIGSRLMDVAEQIAAGYADTVCLGVGLHSGYGSAQRMYVKRGYMPDGSGVWYADSICAPYSSCVNDDDLVLYLSKRL